VDEDIVAIIAITILLGIPLLAISARIALKPIVEAISQLRGDPVSSHARALQDRRLVELEEQMDRVVDEVASLQEVVRFQQSLEAGTPSADRRPALQAMPPEVDRR
jgi:hypothetical protein